MFALLVIGVGSLIFSSCGENNGSVVNTPPPPVATVPAAPTPGAVPAIPAALPVPAAPSPGPVPYTPPVVSDDPVITPTFTNLSRSILQTHCVSCHGSSAPNGEVPAAEGGLDLTTYAGVMTAVIAGDPERSRLFQVVQSAQMPPAEHLSENEIQAIQNWILDGAQNN